MAEIRVEEKRGSLAWLWILLLLLIAAAAVWYFMGAPGLNAAPAAPADSTVGPGASAALDSVSQPLHRPTGGVRYVSA